MYGSMRSHAVWWYVVHDVSNESCFSRWAVFERCAIYHTFGSFETSATLAHKPYSQYVVLAYEWLIVRILQLDWYRVVTRVHVLCGTATLVHCCMASCRYTHCCITALCMTVLVAHVHLATFTCMPPCVSAA